MDKLVCITGSLAGQEYPVGELCVIGRSSKAHIHLEDLSVSRQHARITRLSNKLVIEDLDSGWGTKLNDHFIETAYLRHNDEICIADHRFRFRGEDRARSAESGRIMQDLPPMFVGAEDSVARLLPVQQPAAGETAQNRHLNAVLAASQAINQSVDLKSLLNQSLGYCLDAFSGATRALVATVDESASNLSIQAIAVREGTGRAIAFDQRLVAEALHHGRVVLHSTGTQGVMIAPMAHRDAILGLVCVEGQGFGEQDVQVLRCISTLLATAHHNAQLEQKLADMSETKQDLATAHEVQKHFLPRSVPKMPGFSFVAHYDPCRDVGGDLYDFISHANGNVGVVIGDVSGKGLAAALVMASFTSQVKLAASQHPDPAQVVALANRWFLDSQQDNLFATLLYGVVDWGSMSFRFCNAGHVPPLVYRWASQTVEVVEAGAGLPVGVVRDPDLCVHCVSLQPGDTVVLVTDGVTEAMDAKGRMMGIDGLRRAILDGLPLADDLVVGIRAHLRAFAKDRPQYDDITIVAVGAEWPTEDEPDTMSRDFKSWVQKQDHATIRHQSTGRRGNDR